LVIDFIVLYRLILCLFQREILGGFRKMSNFINPRDRRCRPKRASLAPARGLNRERGGQMGGVVVRKMHMKVSFIRI
jgi:hypothetical protein